MYQKGPGDSESHRGDETKCGVNFFLRQFGQDDGSLSTVFDHFWEDLTKDRRFLDDFRMIKRSLGRTVCHFFRNNSVTDSTIQFQPEARSRFLSNYIMTQVMAFVERQLKLVQLIFLELKLASSDKPVDIQFDRVATLLTGSVDYAILSSVSVTEKVAEILKIEPEEVDDGELRNISATSLNELSSSQN